MLLYNVNYVIIYNFITVYIISITIINIKMSGYIVLSCVYNLYNFYELQTFQQKLKKKPYLALNYYRCILKNVGVT